MIKTEILIEPNLNLSFCIDSDHIFSYFKKAYFLKTILESSKALTQEIQSFRKA